MREVKRLTCSARSLNFVCVMPNLQRIPVLLVVAVLVLLVAICAGDQTRLTQDFEGSEACCGLTHCPVLAMAVSGVALWVAAASLGPTTALPVASILEGPLSPPPELIALRSA